MKHTAKLLFLVTLTFSWKLDARLDAAAFRSPTSFFFAVPSVPLHLFKCHPSVLSRLFPLFYASKRWPIWNLTEVHFYEKTITVSGAWWENQWPLVSLLQQHYNDLKSLDAPNVQPFLVFPDSTGSTFAKSQNVWFPGHRIDKGVKVWGRWAWIMYRKGSVLCDMLRNMGDLAGT